MSKEKTSEILKRIHLMRKPEHGVFVPELRMGTGFCGIAERRIDAFFISPQKGNLTTAYEIKVSRGDFLKDIKDLRKQCAARLFASEFYYAAPKGLIKPDEIPDWAGLIEFNLDERVSVCETYTHCRKIVAAPILNRENPTWGLVVTILRRT